MTPHKRWSLLPALLVMLLLSGCELRADVGVVVDGDGGGTLEITMAADEELRSAAAAADADPLATLAATVEQVPGWEVRRPADGRTDRVTLATTFADPDELARISTEFADALAAPELRPLEPLRLVVDDTTVTLRGGAALEVLPVVRELGIRPGRARAVVADAVRLRIIARMPGEVLETNADERDGDRTVVWSVAPEQRRELLVVARRPWTLARIAATLRSGYGAAAVAAVVALTLLALLVVRRRRVRRGSAGAESGAPRQAFTPSRSARRRARSVRT